MDEPVSVVIPNWNRKELLELCILSLMEQTHGQLEIIVVDNGSTDGSKDLVRERFPGVRLVEFPDNRGFSAAVNAGIDAASGRLVALINNDSEAHPDWAASLVAAAGRHPEAGSFASKILFHSDRTTIDTFGDGFATAGFSYKRGFGEAADLYPDESEVFGACAGAAMYRKSMLEELRVDGEYFDEDFFAFGEDGDLSMRARLYGHACIAVPDAVVFHRLRATAGRGSGLSVYLSHRNFLLTVMKNFPLSLLLRNIVGIAAYHFLAAAADLVRNRRLLYLRSYLAALRMWPKMRPKRRAVQRGARMEPSALQAQLTKRWFRLWLNLGRMSRSVAERGL